MATIDLTKKLFVYDTLCKINQACAEIFICCRSLEELKIFNSEHLRLYSASIQEMQSGMSHEILHGMERVEQQDWFEFGKLRRDCQTHILPKD